ncbi:MAG TPA: signal recognition particle protein [Erysipelotrichaceae bacterium]|nr:MAG: signal recognition particle protein [Firmicutes bacterium GWE2_51_13]HBZ40639.1 signal recognition particle protein [Erysipelotrichaceae bacterium]
MAFDALTQRFTEAFKHITKTDRLTEKNMDDLLKDVRLALLEADVNVQVVRVFLEQIKSKALGTKVLTSMNPQEALIKIIYDQLVELLGAQGTEIAYPQGKTVVIMMVGLQGTGKTTSAAKLANLALKKQGRKPVLIAADLVRPAAIDQLEILGKSIGIQVYAEKGSTNALNVVRNGMAFARMQNYDTVIIDTAGRLHIDEAMMGELSDIKHLVKPDEILLTVDAMTGQDILNVAKSFHEQLDVTGLVVTKFDGDARGGAVLSVRSVAQVPVKFVGTGEKIDDCDLFYPDRMANRLLGMGDLLTLVEKAEEKLDIEASARGMERMMSGQFTFDDMLEQFNQISKMGSLKNLMKMIPGANQLAGQINDEDTEASMKRSKAIILSMTKEERSNPSVLRASRKARIAKGSGTSVTDVNRLVSQFEKTKEQMRLFSRMANKSGMNFKR